MQYLPWILCSVFFCIILLLLFRLHRIRKNSSEICTGIAEKLSIDTNTLLTISGRDPYMMHLANEINQQLQALNQLRLHYQQGNNELKDAITNMSHDLRTPLTAICGYLDLLEREEKSNTVSKYIEMIRNRTEVLKQLTEELFRYSIIVSVNDDSHEIIHVNAVLEECLASFYGTMKERHMEPIIHITNLKVERDLNRFAFLRILNNIISNALKYSDGDFSVTLKDDGTILFTNTAQNLDSVQVGRLFDRFFTVENGRNSSGLGLSIAKTLTERMHGTLTADYQDSKLTFSLHFPEFV